MCQLIILLLGMVSHIFADEEVLKKVILDSAEAYDWHTSGLILPVDDFGDSLRRLLTHQLLLEKVAWPIDLDRQIVIGKVKIAKVPRGQHVFHPDVIEAHPDNLRRQQLVGHLVRIRDS